MSEIAASSELAMSPARAVPAAPAKPAPAFLQQVRAFTAQPAVAKSLPYVGMVALAGLAAMIWMAFSQPPGRTLHPGLGEGDKAAVVEALRSANIPYTLDRSTGALTVPETSFHEARMLLASQGLPKAGPSGDDVINALPLGASRAVEGERLRGAREMDLARTIEAIDVVQTARIHLAVQQPSVFLRDRVQPAASVMLTLAPGRTLSDAQVQAIVHLVASSVPGLAPDGVSVVDQNGRLLSRTAGNGPAAESEHHVAVQAMVEERYRNALATLLTPIVGAGNFTAEVHADMDFSEVQATREDFPENARALRAEQGNWTQAPEGNSAVGIPGALSNEAPPATEVAAQPDGVMAAPATATDEQNAGRRSESYNRNFAVGREVSVTRQQPGQVKRLSVAVALKNVEGAPARTNEELQAIEALVKGAVGFDEQRGDVVALSARNFAAVDAAEASWWDQEWVMPLVRNLTGLLVAALVVFGIGRPMLKKGGAALAKRAEEQKAARQAVKSEIAAAIADQARADPEGKVTLAMIESTHDFEARAALIRGFVRQDPSRAALVVRDLIRADKGEGDHHG